LNYRYIKVNEILPAAEMTLKATWPEGFSPGTPVSLTPEKQLFPNSNLTKLLTHCCGPTEMKHNLITQGML